MAKDAINKIKRLTTDWKKYLSISESQMLMSLLYGGRQISDFNPNNQQTNEDGTINRKCIPAKVQRAINI